MTGFLWSLYLYTVLMYKYLLEIIKRRSKVQEKNMLCERALNFHQWKKISKNYKPITVWLWLVYKFTENNCCLRLLFEFIQTQKRHPTSLEKISILTWKLLVISSQNFLCELNSQIIYSLQNISSVAATLNIIKKYCSNNATMS